MRETAVARGQRFQKADGTGIVFEVLELVARSGMPHARLSRLDNPGEERVIAVVALLDKRLFVPAVGALPVRERQEPVGASLATAPGD